MAAFVGKDGKGKSIDFVVEDGMNYPVGTVGLMECGGFKQQLEQVRGMNIRDDDVMIAAFVKSGMHWLWEIVSMIVNNRTEYDKNCKENAMLDFVSKEHIDNLPSPRVVNMHFPVRWLPRQLLEKRRPILHVMRNPKDMMVSYFNHYNNIPSYQHVDCFSDFLPMMIGENGFYLKYPWFKYELEWEQFTKKNPDYPILNLYYEDMKKEPAKSITKIVNFLNSDVSKETVDEICARTDIKQMRDADTGRENPVLPGIKVDGNPIMYRKGIIGDWKNWFTVAESEKVDTWLEQNLVNTDLKFQYS